DGRRGLGFAVAAGTGRALRTAVADDAAPLLVGEDPLPHERLAAKLRRSLAPEALAAIDLALWDLKGRGAGLPLWQFLGRARDAAPAHSAETASPHLTADEVIALGRAAVGRGLRGVRMAVAGADPEADSRKILAVRDALGEEIWFGVSAGGGYDYETALPMGR